MKKTIVTLASMCMVGAVALSGCSSSTSGTDSSGKTKIRFASWDSAEDVDKQQVLVDQFNASQDEIQVVLEAYGSEYDTKISAGMGSKDTPDVLYMWNYPAYYQGLEPLDSYIEAEGPEFKDNFYETLWGYNSIDGSVYGAPVGFTTHVLFYNKDIFAQAGVAEPTSDWTWDDLNVAAKTITEKVDGVKGFGFPMKPDPYDFEMYLWSNGASYGSLNSNEAVEVLDFFQGMEKDGIAVATEKNGTDEFRSGKTAMYVYGSWSLASLNRDGVNYGVVKLPSFKGASNPPASILSSSGISISKDSKNKEAAWEFVKYWTSEEMNIARMDYELPALKSVVESQNIMEDSIKAPFYAMLEQSNGYTPTSFSVSNWSVLNESLTLAFERIFNPSVLEEPKKVLDEVATEFN